MPSLNDQELDRRFVAYEAELRDYEVRWWTRDTAVEEFLRARPNVLPKLVSLATAGQIIETSDVYRDPGPEWFDGRVKIQDRLLHDLIGGAAHPVTSPTVVFLLGIPGSGKSTVLKPIAENYLADRAPLTRDADEIRARLPEYRAGHGSHVVQTEVVDLTYARFARLVTPNSNLLVDVVGDPRWLPLEIRHFASLGLAVAVLCAEVPLGVAERRAKLRAIDTGRHVSLAYLRSCAGRPRRALDQALDEGAPIDHWVVVDTASEDGIPRVLDGDGEFGAPGAQIAFWP